MTVSVRSPDLSVPASRIVEHPSRRAPRASSAFGCTARQQHRADNDRKQHKQNEQELAESARKAVLFFFFFGRLGIAAGFRHGAVPARLLPRGAATLRLPQERLERLTAGGLVVVLLHPAE